MQPFESQPGGAPPAVASDQVPPGFMARLGAMFGGGGDGTDAGAPVDPYKDTKAILAFVEKIRKEAFENRWVYERSWWRILLYILGRHWIYYDRKRGQWLDKRMAKWIPRPVTNMVQVALNTIKTVFAAIQLETTARPLTNDGDAVATADTVDSLEPLIADEHRMKRVMREHDFWFIALGNCILQLWFNPTAKTTITQYQECTTCQGQYTQDEMEQLSAQTPGAPMCPECGGADFQPAEDEYGYPVGDEEATGAGCTDALSPFEYATKPGVTNLDDSPYLVRIRWRGKDEAIELYGEDQCKAIVWAKMPNERSLQLLRAIANQTDVSSTPVSYGGEENGGDGVAEYEFWVRPTHLYKHGLVARVLGEQQPILVSRDEEALPGPLPYHTQKGEPLFPFVHSVYEDIGGRMNGRGALDVMLNKNDQLNQLDSMAALSEQRMSNPVWLEPKGAEVKSFTGEPGLVVKYTPNVAGSNAKPERIPGQNIPPSLFTRREQIKSDIEELVGTYDVLKGGRPPGVDAFSALNLLKELSESRFGPAMQARAETYREWYSIAIEIERQFGPDNRIRAAMRPNRSWTFKKFQKADLTGAIDIIIEDGTQLPKTALGKRAAIEHGNQLGVLNTQDPEVSYSVMQEIGIAHLAPSLDASMKGALREQDLFEAWVQSLPPAMPGQPPTPLVSPEGMMAVQPKPVTTQVEAPPAPGAEPGAAPQMQAVTTMVAPPPGEQVSMLFPNAPLKVRPWDKHMVHVVQHDIYCQSDEAIEMFAAHPDLEMLWALHREAHLEAAAQDAMQQAAMAAGVMPGQPPGAPGQPGAAPPQGASRALANSNQNSNPKKGPPQGPPPPPAPQPNAVM